MKVKSSYNEMRYQSCRNKLSHLLICAESKHHTDALLKKIDYEEDLVHSTRSHEQE